MDKLNTFSYLKNYYKSENMSVYLDGLKNKYGDKFNGFREAIPIYESTSSEVKLIKENGDLTLDKNLFIDNPSYNMYKLFQFASIPNYTNQVISFKYNLTNYGDLNDILFIHEFNSTAYLPSLNTSSLTHNYINPNTAYCCRGVNSGNSYKNQINDGGGSEVLFQVNSSYPQFISNNHFGYLTYYIDSNTSMHFSIPQVSGEPSTFVNPQGSNSKIGLVNILCFEIAPKSSILLTLLY